MRRLSALYAVGAISSAVAATPDAGLRDVQYDPHAVVTVLVAKGVVTHILLDEDESIMDVASGLGADCAKPESTWCVAAQAGGRSIFIKPKSGADAPNNLAVVTDKRVHSFRLVLAAHKPATAAYRVVVHAPKMLVAAATSSKPAIDPAALEPPSGISSRALVAERLAAAPAIVNSSYSIAEGENSDDIVPTLVFDDGRFTYLRFPGSRAIPAVFHVLPDGSETVVNVRMEDDVLVVDRVSRHLMLRAGAAAVGVWNEDFDIEGTPPNEGTTVTGVRRVVRAVTPSQANFDARGSHE